MSWITSLKMEAEAGMVKSELVAALVADGLDPTTARASIDSFGETIARHLEIGGDVTPVSSSSWT